MAPRIPQRPARGERLLLPSEVARLFRVEVPTVARWEKTGKISSVRTPGNKRRYRETEVLGLLNGSRANRTAGTGGGTS